MITVSVLMPTYNHQFYIVRAIESFLLQQCTFQTELLIGDDCSTDDTLIIAKRYAELYPERIKVIAHLQNLGLLNNYKSLIDSAQGKFIAILESDDYWLDPLKLQKQVDFLENHPDYSLVYTNWRIVNEKDEIIGYSNMPAKYCGNLYEIELCGNMWAAVTVCFSLEKYRRHCSIEDYILLGFKTFDYPTWLALAANSKIGYLPDYTAAYRISALSISNNSDWEKVRQFVRNMNKIVRYSVKKFGYGKLSKKDIHNADIKRYMGSALKNNQLDEVRYFSRKLVINDLKTAIIKFFPSLWIKRNLNSVNKSKLI